MSYWVWLKESLIEVLKYEEDDFSIFSDAHLASLLRF